MAKIVGIEFPKAHNAVRKGMVHVGHGLVKTMIANKESGDHVAVHFDDGTTVRVVIRDAHIKTDSLLVDVEEGMEP